MLEAILALQYHKTVLNDDIAHQINVMMSSFRTVLRYHNAKIATKIWAHISCRAVLIKTSNLLICFCSFDLSCPILKKEHFIEKLYSVLSCIIKYRHIAPW